MKYLIAEFCRDKWNVSTRSLAKHFNQNSDMPFQNKVSHSTISRYLQNTDWGKTAYRIQVRPLLTSKNIRDRIHFCEEIRRLRYCGDTLLARLKLENILFTDESIIELYPKPNTQNMRIRTANPEERESLKIPKHGLKIMVAGGMTANGLTSLHVVEDGATVTGEYYRHRILPIYFAALDESRKSTIVGASRIFSSVEHAIFMQDGAPAHTAHETLYSLSQRFDHIWSKGFWPGNSPDLNPIEHIWPIIKDSIFQLPRPKNKLELILRVQQTWNLISVDLLKKLIFSFPRRIEACVLKGGQHSGY
jgi:transposase